MKGRRVQEILSFRRPIDSFLADVYDICDRLVK